MNPNHLLTTIALVVISSLFFKCRDDNDPRGKAAPVIKDCKTCTFIVPAGQSVVDGQVLGVKAGDTICLNAATRYDKDITFKNIVGSKDAPVIITNCDGTVHIAVTNRPINLKTANSKYFRITGGDTDDFYGIILSGSTANGLVLTDFSTNFEVDHLEIHNVGFAGIMAKTDPSCNDATVRGNFTMKDVSFHHNFIHDTEGEGFYIGHFAYSGFEVSGCGMRLPHTIEGISINHNYVLRSGWDGIQLGCAVKGAEVHHNIVEDYGKLNKAAQHYGIILGGGTGGKCYSNFINGGTGGGLTMFGIGDNVVYNNIIMNAGEKGIFCDERGETKGDGVKIINNTIINPKTEGIAIYTETLPSNVCMNNAIINPGSFDSKGESAYVLTLKDVKVEKANNYFTRSIDDVKFVNKDNDFRLQKGSPLIDQGSKDVEVFDIATDFYGATRLKGIAYDIGATEF